MGTFTEQHKGRLRIGVDEKINGVKQLDLYVDYVSPESRIGLIPNNAHTIGDYLRTVLAPVACPVCHAKKMCMAVGGSPREWFLRIAGRRVFRCSQCEAVQVVKVHGWEWEIVGTVAAASLVIMFFSIHWFAR